MKTITITLRNNIYHATNMAWVPLFGADTLPTPYTGTKSREDVLALIRGMNPGVTVTMGE